jgi:hypothetical protein
MAQNLFFTKSADHLKISIDMHSANWEKIKILEITGPEPNIGKEKAKLLIIPSLGAVPLKRRSRRIYQTTIQCSGSGSGRIRKSSESLTNLKLKCFKSLAAVL